MTKYQERQSDFAIQRFQEIFGDLPEGEQLKLAETLGKITEVCR